MRRWQAIPILLLVLHHYDTPGLRAQVAAADSALVQRNVMVAMRDGIKLATDIYLPRSAAGRLPAILERTPYGKNGCARSAQYFVAHGYAYVCQDVRGRFASEGVWWMLGNDGPDGYDIIEWIARQSWSDGKVGMLGTSYVGGTQHAAALEQAPHLTTVIPVDAMSNMGYQSMRNAGAFELRFWNFIYNRFNGARQSRDSATATVLAELTANRLQYVQQLPLRRGTTPLQVAPEYEEWLVEAMKHGGNDDFWKQNNIIDNPARYKDIPVYLVGGWYDSWAGNTVANYIALSKTIKSPVYLIMGPWVHGQQGNSAHGQVSFGASAAIPDPLAWRKEWYDHWLKGIDNGVGKADPFRTRVRIFVMGTGDERKDAQGRKNHGGYWRDEQEWPLARTRYTDYFLGTGGTLGPAAPSAARAGTSLRFDPKAPVPTIGGNTSTHEGLMLQGAYDQKCSELVWNCGDSRLPLSARNDVLVFRTEPLTEDIEVTGEVQVKLYVSSSALDTDFTAKLVDVHPPTRDYPAGFDQAIGDGIIRARFRESLKAEKLMTPGQVYEVTIRLYPTSNVFKKGHRIRLDVSSSNFPRFDINPNTGEPLNDNRRWEVAINTVYHDRARPSRVILPIIPGK